MVLGIKLKSCLGGKHFTVWDIFLMLSHCPLKVGPYFTAQASLEFSIPASAPRVLRLQVHMSANELRRVELYGIGWDLQGSYMEGLGGERGSKPNQSRLTHWKI